jgi:hypothetical protein
MNVRLGTGGQLTPLAQPWWLGRARWPPFLQKHLAWPAAARELMGLEFKLQFVSSGRKQAEA